MAPPDPFWFYHTGCWPLAGGRDPGSGIRSENRPPSRLRRFGATTFVCSWAKVGCWKLVTG